MAIGSLDKAGRLDQLRTLARVQVWSGYLTADEVRTDVLAAVSDEESDPATAERLTEEFVEQAHTELAEAAQHWPAPTAYDRLQSAFADLRARDVVVLEACDDHWAANDVLTAAAERGASPAGIAYFTHADVWHAVEHGMLELNVWHGSSANVAPGDALLVLVQESLAAHGIASLFDEGRIEVSLAWERRPHTHRDAPSPE
jgi:hypothetical protein